MSECTFEELGHTAEVGMRVQAPTPAALFACAARAMFAIAGAHAGPPQTRRDLTVESFDAESLLVDWLSELLYWHEHTGEIYDQVEVTSWTPTRLRATITGSAVTAPPRLSIKAVTYYGLRVAEEAGQWVAEVYFDI